MIVSDENHIDYRHLPEWLVDAVVSTDLAEWKMYQDNNNKFIFNLSGVSYFVLEIIWPDGEHVGFPHWKFTYENDRVGGGHMRCQETQFPIRWRNKRLWNFARSLHRFKQAGVRHEETSVRKKFDEVMIAGVKE